LDIRNILKRVRKEIGFDVTYLNGRVYNWVGKRGREFDHLTLLVRIPNDEIDWLADVGFGDSFFEPLRFEYNGEKVQGQRAFRLDIVKDGIDLLRRDCNGMWGLQYFFDLQTLSFPIDYLEITISYHNYRKARSPCGERAFL